jgi:hypothetical protein
MVEAQPICRRRAELIGSRNMGGMGAMASERIMESERARSVVPAYIEHQDWEPN